jgi:hypothetical protein
MEYNEFLEYVKNSMEQIMGEEAYIEIKDIIKNNDSIWKALIIREEEDNITPTIYLENYYEEFKRGEKLPVIVGRIFKAYKDHKVKESINFESFKNFTAISDRIVYKLINTKCNELLLKEVPHMDYLDLSLVFYCLIDNGPFENASMTINFNHLNLWGIEVDELLKVALVNTPKLLPYKIASMEEVIKEIIGDSENRDFFDIPEDDDKRISMFVLTNEAKINGAACILYKKVIKDFAKEIDRDIYIIPSSIHEVILVPQEKSVSIEELNNMVVQVNEDEVAKHEILSDHIYQYRRTEDEIMIC